LRWECTIKMRCRQLPRVLLTALRCSAPTLRKEKTWGVTPQAPRAWASPPLPLLTPSDNFRPGSQVRSGLIQIAVDGALCTESWTLQLPPPVRLRSGGAR
jgi:hypothetical protein